MMENIAKLQQFIILNILIIFLNCFTPPGPIFLTYKNLGNLREIRPKIPSNQNFIVYTFSQYNNIYKENLLGEIILQEKTYKESQTIVSKLSFTLRVLSFNHIQNIRMRVYQGSVYYDKQNELLDLHSENCYTFAKKDFRDRFYPVEGWTCDHLVWLFKVEDKKLIPVNSLSKDYVNLSNNIQNRILYTNWHFISNPVLYNYEKFNKPVWFGTFIQENQEELIFFGYNADVFLNSNDLVNTLSGNLSFPIKEVVNDFVFIDKKRFSSSQSKEIIIYSEMKKNSFF